MVPESHALPTLLRPRELRIQGISPSRFRGLIRSGTYERVTRGVYFKTTAECSELLTVAEVFKRVPHAVLCLYSALELHDIGTQAPKQLWIAIDRKARAPLLPEFDLRIVRFSGPFMREGVAVRETDGVPYRITSPARTICDCFRFRRKFGLDAALEALKDGIRSRIVSPAELSDMAGRCRIGSVMRPYLEAIAS